MAKADLGVEWGGVRGRGGTAPLVPQASRSNTENYTPLISYVKTLCRRLLPSFPPAFLPSFFRRAPVYPERGKLFNYFDEEEVWVDGGVEEGARGPRRGRHR